MDSRLRGMEVPSPLLIEHPVSEPLKHQEGFSKIQTFYPGLGLLCPLKKAPEEEIWLNSSHRVVAVVSQQPLSGSGKLLLEIEANGTEPGKDRQTVSGFRKLTHLLDPVRWLQGKYSLPKHVSLPWHQESWEAAWTKLQDPMNQAYVEAVAAYALGKIREADASPHFHRFFGAFCAMADTYSYSITDSYMSYRHTKWFWAGQEKKLFRVKIDETLSQDVKDALLNRPETLDESDEEETDASEEELSADELSSQGSGSLKSASGSAFEEASEEESEEETSEDHTDDEEELEIFAELKDFPVMMIFTEASEGTMDDLLDDFEEVGCEPGSAQWELTWKAWIFQVIAALCVGQSVLGFTHNDLHTNNVVWSKTDLTHLVYTARDGTLFKVPTFGKIFKIIDFGRSIFRLNETVFFSDDFRKGNDAADQFNFGELYDPSEPEVYPNPSFDLCRFTVSLFESLFPEEPTPKKGGKILSQEPDLTVYETESDLYNVMWSWLLCDDGHNVLMDPDGSERYPDFDLYKVITSEVHGAVPCEQVKKSVFACFQTKEPQTQKAYSLFC